MGLQFIAPCAYAGGTSVLSENKKPHLIASADALDSTR